MYLKGKAIVYGKQRKYGIVSGYRPHLAEKDSDELYGIVFTEVSEMVKSTRNLSEKVPFDCVGTIVMVYTSPRMAYEMEFFDAQGNTLEVLTVEEKDIVASNMRR